MIIQQAVLHYYDANALQGVYSASPLNLDDPLVYEYLESHFERAAKSPDNKSAVWQSHSSLPGLLAAYETDKDFSALAKALAERIIQELIYGESETTRDVVVAEIEDDHRLYLGLLILKGRQGYVHYDHDDGTLAIVKRDALLPSLTQRAEAWALIPLQGDTLYFKDVLLRYEKEKVALLEELVLLCVSEPSSREAMRTLKKVTREVAEAYGEDKVMAQANMKRYIADRILEVDRLSQAQLATAAFPESDLLQQRFQESCQSEALPEEVQLSRDHALRETGKQKLATDSGVKVEIPLAEMDDVSFVTEKDGSLTLVIKNIQHIEDR